MPDFSQQPPVLLVLLIIEASAKFVRQDRILTGAEDLGFQAYKMIKVARST